MRALILAFFLALGVTPASAQAPGSPEALSAATELMAVISKDMISQMSQQMTAQIWPKVEAEYKSKVDDSTLADMRSEFQRILVQFVTDSMKLAPPVYARYFSVQELHDMQAFYRTPTGAKALQLMPKVMADFFGAFAPNLAGFDQSLQVAFNNVLQKHGYAK